MVATSRSTWHRGGANRERDRTQARKHGEGARARWERSPRVLEDDPVAQQGLQRYLRSRSITARGGTNEMGDPILLPKFELPGDKTHWAVRLAVISGITLLLAVVGLGAVIMNRHKLEVEAHVAREEAIARVK